MNEAPTGGTARASNLSATCEKLTMTSIATQISTINVPFHGQSVPTIYHDGQPFIAMRPIVENIGIDWTGQSVKLRNQREKFNCRDISMVAADGKIRSLLCLPLKKLNGWLFSINPERVRADIKDKLIQYQDECFSVLHDYWTKGEAVNPRKKTTVDQRTPLRDAVNMLVGKKGLRYDDAYNMVHQRFAIDSIDELELTQIPEAVEYIHRVVLDGEYLGKQESIPAPALKIDYPITWWNQYDYVLKSHGVSEFSHANPCRFPVKMLFGDCSDSPSPALRLLAELSDAGYNIDAVRLEILAHRHYADVMYNDLERITRISAATKDRATGFRISPPSKPEWR